MDSEIKISSEIKKCLFLSHEMSYTGAPHSALRICKILSSEGVDVDVFTVKSGPFEKEFKKIGIIVKQITNCNDVYKIASNYDIAIVNTIVPYRYAFVLSMFIPTIWYIRESAWAEKKYLSDDEAKFIFKKFNNIVFVSDYASESFLKYNSNIRIVHNSVEDYYNPNIVVEEKNYVEFIQLGMILPRKGCDLVIAAYQSLDVFYKDKIKIIFAGAIGNQEYYKKYFLNCPKNITYIGEITDNTEKIKICSESDVFLVSSREEPCSLAALEGAMLSKPLILSSNVGAKYIVTDENGFVVKVDENYITHLADTMKFFVDNKDKISKMGSKSREMYEKTSSMNEYRKSIIALVNDVCMFKDNKPNYSNDDLIQMIQLLHNKNEFLEQLIKKHNKKNDLDNSITGSMKCLLRSVIKKINK